MQFQIPTIVKQDPWLNPYAEIIYRRQLKAIEKELELIHEPGNISDFSTGYLYFGMHRTTEGWIMREWAPNASQIVLTGDFSEWRELPRYKLQKKDHGIWELSLPKDALHHRELYKLSVYWEGGRGYRIPSRSRFPHQTASTSLNGKRSCSLLRS